MLLDDFCIEQVKATEVYYDNRSAIEMVKNHAFHGKNKKFGVCNFESKENVDWFKVNLEFSNNGFCGLT